mgnify:CR=1 FL=1
MPNVVKKKLLTEDDLLNFCQEQKFVKFNSKDTGYQLALKVPTTFEVDNAVDENHRGMMKLKFKIFHTGLNRNKSYVSKEAAEKAMGTIADRPVLAAIHQLDDGSWDFEGHEMEIILDGDGNREIKYIESQVGSFSSEPAFWEHDDELNKDYVCAYAYISEEYTRACEIIRQKQGSKNSCELFIDDFSFNAKEKYLELNDFYVNASTLLGSHDDGTQIQEGMEGSRADIADFSVDHNSVKFDKDEKIIELLENMNKLLANFSDDKNNQKGGTTGKMFEELLKKYNKTVEDITFEYENLSDEELEAKFAEMFENDNTGTGEGNNGGNSGPEGNPGGEEQTFEKMTRTYELSHDDIRYALYQLLSTYEDSDNDWYFINAVYDDHFTYENWNGDKIFGQKYEKDGDNVAFDGERYNLHRELLTDSEFAELQSMRSNYTALKEFKETAEKNELHNQREAILSDEKYSVLAENEAFAELKNNMDNYSLTDLEKEAKVIFADYVASVGEFSAKENKASGIKMFGNMNSKSKPKKRYGSLFDI